MRAISRTARTAELRAAAIAVAAALLLFAGCGSDDGDDGSPAAKTKRGARSTGVEFNPKMVALSERIARREGVGGKAKFVQGDFFKTDFSKATVLSSGSPPGASFPE